MSQTIVGGSSSRNETLREGNENRLSSSERGNQLGPRNSSVIIEGERFLGFSLGDSINALIPLVDLQATIKISLAEILPVPQMKESLLGIINYRGKATWVLDLAHLMGSPNFHLHTAESATGMGMLFEVENETVALSIDRVKTIETYDLSQLLPINDGMFSDRMRSFLSGYFMDSHQQPWVVVNLQQVTRSII